MVPASPDCAAVITADQEPAKRTCSKAFSELISINIQQNTHQRKEQLACPKAPSLPLKASFALLGYDMRQGIEGREK